MSMRLRAAAAALAAVLLCRPAGAVLTAAAGKVDITPDLSRERIYMGGFGATGRRPSGVHDPLYARVVVLSDGKLTLAIVGLDLLGFYRNDVQDLRSLSGFDQPGRYLFAASTHDHSGPDTLGLWGPMIGVSGVNMRYHQAIKRKIAATVKRLAAELEPARLSAAQTVVDPRGLCRDSRDPVVINPYLAEVSITKPSGKAIATIVNWSCHAEVLGPSNRLITADFPGPLCSRVEEKTGGECVFLNGTIGGLLTPDVKPPQENFYGAYRLGAAVADRALAAAAKPVAPPSSSAKLAVRSVLVKVPVENSRYLLFLPALTFGHRIYDAQGDRLTQRRAWLLALEHLLGRLKPQDLPLVHSEVSVLDLGPARFLGIPAELFPELAIGGYDGRYRFGHPLIHPDNPNPPDLSRAPKGPYLRELIKAPVEGIVGLANDELGYVVPNYDFKVQRTLSMLPRLPGNHYEETNSIGPSQTKILVDAAAALLSPGKAKR